MNTKSAVAVTILNVAAVAASAAMLVAAKFENVEMKSRCDAAEVRLAEAAKDAKNAETSMLAAYSMLQTIEQRVFKANLEWNERENKRVLDALQKKLEEDSKESMRRISELTGRASRTNATERAAGR